MPNTLARLPIRYRQLNAIVNNAGIVVSGPVEAVPPTEVRRQFEVNVIGQLAVTQAVLPRLRRSRGRIVRSLYARHLEGLAQSIPEAERLVLPADRVAEVVAQALTTRRPRARYVVGLNARMQLAVLPNLPTAARDRLFHTLARQPR